MKRLFIAGAFLAALFVSLIPTKADAASRFAICSTTCTWDGSSTAMWSASSGGATGASVPTSADSVTLDASTCVGGTTCTITVNTTVNVQTLTLGACTASTSGCVLDFSINNNNVTLQGFSGTGTGTRTLKMGNGTWTISGGFTGTVWDFTTTTGLTFNANSSTLAFSATGANQSRTWISGAGLTYNAVTIAESVTSRSFTNNSGGTTTIANLTLTAPLNYVNGNGGTLSVTTLSMSGSAFNNAISLLGLNLSMSAGTINLSWLASRSTAFSGGATFNLTNSFDLGGNTGTSTFTGPGGGGGRIIGG